ncbi:MAG: CcdC protein domain-containing protein [Sphingomonas oligoaromativorans]|uniref:CcdC protein domain-containing protein n=1 Tax=Sphingomonas oligoaromativorans TaxID=575322 RepID=UPI00141ED4E2|nr:CcdC protein domain-containing protein [Sphingomonas oligoaromativorans]NIJ33040.1 hypothetical protein [Sphingomonas oligoaromativorans]
MQGHQAAGPWLSYAIPFAIIAVVMALRWRSMRRARKLRVEMLWILPAVYAAIMALVFFESPPGPSGWLWSALALGGGAAIGWYRGRMMRITVDPETHELSQQASPAAFFLLIGLVLVRSVARQEMGGSAGPQVDHHAAMLATDILMAFAFGLIAATRVEMALRARRLLAAARLA